LVCVIPEHPKVNIHILFQNNVILGRITGKVTTTYFEFNVTHNAQKFMFIQVHHKEVGFVLAQIVELIRTNEQLLAQCSVIGYKDEQGRLQGIRTPFEVGSEILEAENEFISNIIELDIEGGYIGKLEGKDIKVHIDLQKLLTKHLCVLAKSGAGKSYTVGVLLEEIMQRGIPLLVIDPHGEYPSMRFASADSAEEMARWDIKGKGYTEYIQEFGDPSIKEGIAPLKLSEKMSCSQLMKVLPVNLSNTQESMLFSVMKDLDEVSFDTILLGLQELNTASKWPIMDALSHMRKLQLFSQAPTAFSELIRPRSMSIINLRGMEPAIQDVVVYKLLNDLFLARKRGEIPPFFCIVEEAHNFCPEKGFGKAKSLDVLRLISSEGRKFGLGLAVITQRPALVQKTILSQCSTQIIMKVTNPNDLRALAGSVEGYTPQTENEIQNLPIGSALVCGVVDRPLVVKIRPRKSLHGGDAVNMLAFSQEEQYRDVNLTKSAPETENESKSDEKKEKKDKAGEMYYVIKPAMSKKEISLVASKKIQEIKTYLIPSVLIICGQYSYLIDRIKGKVVIDPDNDITRDLQLLDEDCHYPKLPQYMCLNPDIILDPVLTSGDIREKINLCMPVDDIKECFIMFHKVQYQE